MPTALSIPDRTLSHFNSALDSSHIYLYDTAAVVRSTEPDVPDFVHLVHLVPDLASKPPPPLKTPDLSREPDRDPFGGPEYGPDDRERVLDLGGPEDQARKQTSFDSHSIVHNLHALCTEHEMIVPSFAHSNTFRPQTSDLTLQDIEAAWRVVASYHEADRDIVLFFNGGPLAGASQPHLHMQFVPFQNGLPGPVAVARNMSTLRHGQPAQLPLPWTMFVCSLGDAPTPTTIHESYRSLLSHSRTYLDTLDESELPPAGPKRQSYNLFLTSEFLFLCPRSDRLSRIPRRASKSESDQAEIQLSVNGLLVLGYWYLGSQAEIDDLLAYTPGQVLIDAGYPNKSFTSKSS